MLAFEKWVQKFPGQKVFVAWPATFDFMFVYWYFMYFLDRSEFEYHALDVKSYAMGTLKNKSFYETTKDSIPERFHPRVRDPHISVEDAIEEGECFFLIYRENTAE